MNNPVEEKQPLYKNWKVVLTLAVVSTIVITTIIRIMTPPLAPPPTKSELVAKNYNNTISDLSQLVYIGSTNFQPDTAKVVVAKLGEEEVGSIPLQVISNLGLVQSGTTSWSSNDWQLIYIKSPGFYELLNLNQPTQEAILDKNQSVQTARQFIANNLGIDAVSAISQSIIYYQGLGEFEETTEFKATSMKIPFTYSVDGYPVYFDQQNFLPIEVFVGNNYQIQKVTFQPKVLSYLETKEYDPISIEQAVENMSEKNVGSFIRAFTDQHGLVSLTDRITGELTTGSFEYRYDEKNQAIYPFYRFYGTLKDNKGMPFDAEIITPAI